jgi:chromosome segregation ATPase
MSTESETTTLQDSPAAEVDRIRDIIFGPQMRLYEQQFKRVVGQLDLLSNQLEDLRATLDQKQAEQESHTREVQAEMLQRHTDLEHTFSSRLEQLEAKFDQQGADLRAESRQLAADLRTQGQDLRGEFTSALDALDDDKTSRHNLGDLLQEMGTRLKQQVGVADLLGQLGAMAEDQPAD